MLQKAAHHTTKSNTHLQEICTAMADDAITLHLSKAQASIPCPSLYWLPCQHGNRPSRSGMDLVINHVLQALVVGGIQEDLGFELSTGVTVVHHLPAPTLIPHPVQQSDCHASTHYRALGVEAQQQQHHNQKQSMRLAVKTCLHITADMVCALHM